MSGQHDGFFEGLSRTTTTTTPTMPSHVKANSAPISATAITTITQPTATSIADAIKNQEPHILFDAPPDRVYDAKTNPPNETTVFKMPFTLLTDGLKVTNLGWYVLKDSDATVGLLYSVVPEQPWNQIYQQPQTGTNRDVMGKVRAFISDQSVFLGKPMVFGINWAAADGSGITYSPAFAIVKDGDQAVQQAQDNIDKSRYKNGIEKNLLDGSEITGTGQSVFATIITDPSTASTTASTATPTPSLGLNTHGAVAGRSRGLSAGAVAGIAVGVGLAALLAAALAIFFFLRRRRRHRQAPASSASDSAAALELEQKRAEMENLRASAGDANGAAGPADAPYRDETTTTTTVPAPAAATTQQQERRRSSVAPKQLPATPPSRSSTEALRAQGVSRHLVEEGMTDAEIRRLEAEEAHLDDEIQRATAARR